MDRTPNDILEDARKEKPFTLGAVIGLVKVEVRILAESWGILPIPSHWRLRSQRSGQWAFSLKSDKQAYGQHQLPIRRLGGVTLKYNMANNKVDLEFEPYYEEFVALYEQGKLACSVKRAT